MTGIRRWGLILGSVLLALLWLGACMQGYRAQGSDLNPAVNQGNIHQTVCVPGYSRSIRPPSSYTSALKVRQLHELGYADQNPRHYEEDHRVPLSLGGAPRDPSNLHPEPWSEARIKDRREVALWRSVCADKTRLTDAQQEMRRW